jgi:hypothetical protein
MKVQPRVPVLRVNCGAEPISRGPEPETACRVDILPYAVGPRNATGRFCAKGPVGARASGIRGKVKKWVTSDKTIDWVPGGDRSHLD